MPQLPQSTAIAVRLWLIPVLAAAFMAAGFCWLSVYVGGGQGGPTALDRRIIELVRNLESPVMTAWMTSITRLGDGVPTAVIACAVLIVLSRLKYRYELLLFILVVAGSGLLNMTLKRIIQRTRPGGIPLVEATGYSFPSGHSMAAFTLYGITAYLIWKHIPRRDGRALMVLISALIIAAIGTSRIYVGVHYPTDVLGAYLASGVWLTVTIGAFRYWQSVMKLRTGR
ncbi:phosphatase PAP2 family protein [Paenibacillus xylaniclasticus]|uniref:phosphatase PAP2 family protein n=1 Tax=Paenibacillus xylaniclasticus TaxID=588083 RepID=UPI0013DF103E|nr:MULTISPECIES: phosphatase PAP2 family protein [Paenibacillus]GFN31953.1 phosphatase PAP2 family protein [Paenibacillus curdlanolyticus]